ncbi:MAG: hypothetical protein JWP79_1727 [Polaromonas sp.]|jgi:hypothetical protein|nr:hypothetical protein [Polaromonas sp.]MDB5844417.1 hypothetical protein [Polaromonas sp.]
MSMQARPDYIALKRINTAQPVSEKFSFLNHLPRVGQGLECQVGVTKQDMVLVFASYLRAVG